VKVFRSLARNYLTKMQGLNFGKQLMQSSHASTRLPVSDIDYSINYSVPGRSWSASLLTTESASPEHLSAMAVLTSVMRSALDLLHRNFVMVSVREQFLGQLIAFIDGSLCNVILQRRSAR